MDDKNQDNHAPDITYEGLSDIELEASEVSDQEMG